MKNNLILKWTFLFNVFLLIQSNSFAQDANFSQYYASGLYLNPAIAGMEPGMALSLNHRSQWRSIVDPYVTSQISFIHPIYGKKHKNETHLGGLGLSIYHDQAGEVNFQTIGVNLSGGYNIQLSSKTRLTFGVQAGFIQKNIKGEYKWGEQFDPYNGFDKNINVSENSLTTNRLYPDISAGFIYYYSPSSDGEGFNAFYGMSGYHLNRPNESLVDNTISKLPILFKAHGGVEIPLGEKISVAPNILGMMQNNVYYLNGGLYFNYKISKSEKKTTPTDLIFGLWGRLQDSYIASVGLGNDNFLVGFSYDFNASSLRDYTKMRGAYEISLSIRKTKERAIKRFHTPRI